MGISGLWEAIGHGETVTIAKYATDHFRLHGRPLRVAVDEPGWRFNNLTPQQVEIIQQKEPAANPIEKTIMWRIFVLMKHNIQPIWVLDGPGRPWKRNKRGGGGRPSEEYERTKLLCQLLDHLKVPHHRAPAEAEAECARMQRLGIVDAVWSDDGDTLMFGATCVIGAHRIGSKWSNDQIRVLRAENMLAEHDFDHESLVLFAMLSGGDYNTAGLPGCGPQTARKVSRKSHGLAHALCKVSKHDLLAWRTYLQEVLGKENKRLEIPSSFPDMRALGHHCNPDVSSDDKLRNLNGLKHGWDRKIDQRKLRVLLRERFNIWTKGYMKHLAPIFMVQQLARSVSQDEALANNQMYDIQLKKTRQKKAGAGDSGEPPEELEKKITFYPLRAVDINLTGEPQGEDWSIWEKGGSHFDPASRVECEILSCFLYHLLPEGTLKAPEPVRRKSKRQNSNVADGDLVEPATTLQSVQSTEPDAATASSAPKQRGESKKDNTAASNDVEVAESAPKKRGRPKKDESTAATTSQPRKRKKDVKEDSLPTPPPAVFRHPRQFSFPTSVASTTNENDSFPLEESSAAPLNRPTTSPSTPLAPSDTPPVSTIPKPGEDFSPRTLRTLRLAGILSATETPDPPAPKLPARKSPPRVPADAEIIDLT